MSNTLGAWSLVAFAICFVMSLTELIWQVASIKVKAESKYPLAPGSWQYGAAFVKNLLFAITFGALLFGRYKAGKNLVLFAVLTFLAVTLFSPGIPIKLKVPLVLIALTTLIVGIFYS